MARLTSGPAVRWLEGRREELNARFERARRRFPSLSAAAVLDRLGRVLPPLADETPETPALLEAIYELVLLHVGRDRFATAPGLVVLFEEVFPAMRGLLLKAPASLPASLSNAVENAGANGQAFAAGIGALAASIEDPELLRGAGAVLAWRLGEARLRQAALDAAASLPARAVLTALGLPEWPDAVASLAVEALAQDSWLKPAERLTPATLARLRGSKGKVKVEEVRAKLKAQGAGEMQSWVSRGHVGEFVGFGGSFAVPPLVLDGGDRHTLFVRAGDEHFQVTADCFGAVCRPVAAPGLSCRTSGAAGLRGALERVVAGKAPHLDREGRLSTGTERARFAELAGATSFAVLPELIVYTTADSHRLRLLGPAREAV